MYIRLLVLTASGLFDNCCEVSKGILIKLFQLFFHRHHTTMCGLPSCWVIHSTIQWFIWNTCRVIKSTSQTHGQKSQQNTIIIRLSTILFFFRHPPNYMLHSSNCVETNYSFFSVKGPSNAIHVRFHSMMPKSKHEGQGNLIFMPNSEYLLNQSSNGFLPCLDIAAIRIIGIVTIRMMVVIAILCPNRLVKGTARTIVEKVILIDHRNRWLPFGTVGIAFWCLLQPLLSNSRIPRWISEGAPAYLASRRPTICLAAGDMTVSVLCLGLGGGVRRSVATCGRSVNKGYVKRKLISGKMMLMRYND